MDVRDLRVAVAVADHLHFGRAAAALDMAQPPLSQRVKAIERELGVSLFERTTRRVRLTAAGAEFVAGARTALSAVDGATRRARAAGRGEAGHLAIGMVGSALAPPLPAIVRAFRTRYPEVVLHFTVLPTAGQLAGLRADELDIGFVRPPLPGREDDLELIPVSREPLVAVVPADHRLARRRRIPVELLADEPFVRFPRDLGPGLFDEISALCRRGGFEPRVAQEAVQLQTIVGLVAAGCGVTIVPRSTTLARPEVVLVPLTPATRLIDLALVLRREARSPAAVAFAALVRDLRRDLR